MKKFFLKTTLLIAVISLICLISTCKKETECKVVVTVKYYYDTTIVVPDASVSISKGDVKSTGKSDANGIYNTTFKLEAILDVYAEKDTSSQVWTPPAPFLTGAAVVRLKPGETVYKTVFIQ